MKEGINMNKQRAKEIACSSKMANVTYNETEIYIESVNDNTDTASIHFLSEPNNSIEVSLSSLQEH